MLVRRCVPLPGEAMGESCFPGPEPRMHSSSWQQAGAGYGRIGPTLVLSCTILLWAFGLSRHG